MARFKIHALNNGKVEFLTYDNATSELLRADGTPVIQDVTPGQWKKAAAISKDNPGRKGEIRTLKVSLGLSCNYECSYCSQRFVPHADSTNPSSIDNFVTMVLDAGIDPERIEFWGGEPLVYWKTLKPLATRLRELFPNAIMSMITNGSLLDAEKNEWIDSMGFIIGLSHDGPGYHARGKDPLDNPTQRAAIMDLYDRLKPAGRISVNAMMHAGNPSRGHVQAWLQERFGQDVQIGEGSFIDPYDEGGLASTFQTQGDNIRYRQQAYKELRAGMASNFNIATSKIMEFVNSIKQARPASALGQKCGMDKSNAIAVDLNGNAVTCQNVSAASVAPNGQPHKIGHLTDLAGVAMRTSTHWSERENCRKCPVLQLCKGSCMFLEGELFKAGCNASFSDNIPFLAAAIEFMTGYIPFYIDGDFREDRKDIFGQFTKLDQEAKPVSPKRVIPIAAI